MFGNIGLLEVGIIALILLVLFGAKRIPVLFGSIGQGIRELRNSFRSDEMESGESASDTSRHKARDQIK